jgi:magnesium-transporting ATPase (P-type)
MKSKNKEEKVEMLAHTSSLILDLAYSQFPLQWQRLGNMQQSASSLLTLISIISALMIGIISQITEIEMLINSLKKFRYSFYVSLIFSFIYLIIALIFMFFLLKPKITSKLKNPKFQLEQLREETEKDLEKTNDKISTIGYANSSLILTINKEIIELEEIIDKNHCYYWKCLISSIFSLMSSFIVLFHLSVQIFKTPSFLLSIVGVFSFLLGIGFILLIIFPKK